MIQLGDKVKVKETGMTGEVTAIVEGKVTAIKDLKTGDVVEVIDKTIELISLIKWFVRIIKSIFK